MPLTIERKLSNHAAAEARRARGKPIWDRKLNLKAILADYPAGTEDAALANKAVRIGQLLRQKLPSAMFDLHSCECDHTLLDIVEFFESATASDFSSDSQLGHEPADVFDDWLEQLYDWADDNRVWLGP